METLSAARHRSGRKAAGRSRSAAGAEKNSPAASFGNGFLKQVFAPVISGLPAAIKDSRKIERSFFHSLEYLSDHFGFTPKDVTRVVYPYNIHLAFTDAQQQLSRIDPFCSLRIVRDQCRPAVLECTHNAGTGNSLFYIPIEPLYRLWQQPEKHRTANLILSLFAYLYRSGVSYYRNEGDFLYYEYEMMENWYREDDTAEESVAESLVDLAMAKKQGDLFFRKIARRKNFNAFERRLNRYRPASDWEQQLLLIASSFFLLAKQYPGRSYFDNIRPAVMETGEEDSYAMHPEHYLSFFWSAQGQVYDQLMQCVNNELGEMYGVEEPVQMQLFDQPFTDDPLLDFEKRLLAGIDDLCYLFNQ